MSSTATWLPNRLTMCSTRSAAVSGGDVPEDRALEDGHADRDAPADLLQDHRARAVGDLRRHLDAAVDRPGVHHDRVGLGVARACAPRARTSATARACSGTGDASPVEPLALHAQHHHDVGAVEAVLEPRARRARARASDRRRSPRCRAGAASTARTAGSARRAWRGTGCSSARRASARCRRRSRPRARRPCPCGGGSSPRRAAPASGARAGRRRR